MCFEKLLLNFFPNSIIQFFNSSLSLIYRNLQTAADSSKSTNSLKQKNKIKIPNLQMNIRNPHFMIPFSLAQAMVYGSPKYTASERKRFHYCLIPMTQMQGSFLSLKSPSSALPGTGQPENTSDSDQTEKMFSLKVIYMNK